jgi:SAM-dependent methyltransferase
LSANRKPFARHCGDLQAALFIPASIISSVENFGIPTAPHFFNGHPVDPSKLNHWLLDLIPQTPGTVLDVGAGSGRDAAWFALQGHDVVAVEPSNSMRAEAQRLHVDPRVQWIP